MHKQDIQADSQPSLSHNPRKLDQLRETLFLLWGELAERKDAYLAAHPDIVPDADFSARAHGVVADGLPFDACVQETGGVVPGWDAGTGAKGDMPENLGWWRWFEMFDTQIVGENDEGDGDSMDES